MQFPQNHKASYGASLKQKRCCFLLKCQIKYSTFGAILSHLPNYLDYVFQNLALSLFSIYGEMSPCEKLRKPTNKMLQTDKQTDRWTDEDDWLFKTPSVKMVVRSYFSEIQELNFRILYGLIVSLTERINTRKRNTINIVQCSKREHWKYIH